jgi:cytosine/adenosine deaminase-related metal-dependent hydrolase
VILDAARAVLPIDGVDGADGFEVVPARITLDGPRIVAVERRPTTPPPPGADTLGGHLLTPAFVNAHTHLALVGLRGAVSGGALAGNVVEDLFFRVERRLTRDDVRALTAVGAMECLLSGTAVAWDHYYMADGILDGLDDVGLGGVVAPALQDLDGPGADAWEDALALTEALAGDRRLAHRGLGVCLGPHASDTVSDALWRRVADAAERLALPVHGHVAQSVDEVRRARAVGATALGRIARTGALDAGPSWVLAHGLFLTDAELGALDDRHTLVACPQAQAQFAFPAPVDRWTEAGVRWVVATDAAASNDATDVRGELRSLALLATADVGRGEALAAWRASGELRDAERVGAARSDALRRRADLLDPTALLHRVWTLPGRLHPALPCGAIRPGALAHLALWDTDHPSMWPGDDPLRALALGSCTGALQQVMVAGAWRGERGALRASLASSCGWIDLREEAGRRRAALLRG